MARLDLGKVKGEDAKINGVNELTIIGGDNITTSQEGSSFIISAEVPTKVSDLENDTGFIVESSLNDLFKNASYNGTTGVITFTRYDNSTVQIDLPLELLIQRGYYDATNKNIVLVLANGDTIEISASELVKEYYADGTTIEKYTSNNQETFRVKSGVFQTTETGKGLSTNDFTNELKTKLQNVNNTVTLTQAEYEQITPVADTFYYIIEE